MECFFIVIFVNREDLSLGLEIEMVGVLPSSEVETVVYSYKLVTSRDVRCLPSMAIVLYLEPIDVVTKLLINCDDYYFNTER